MEHEDPGDNGMATLTEKQLAHELIERLEGSQLPTAVRFLEFMLLDPVSRSIATAPADTEPLTEEAEQALDRADTWLKQNGGKGIPHEEILAEFGLTVNDFPLKENGA
jgi:hypothetical protein